MKVKFAVLTLLLASLSVTTGYAEGPGGPINPGVIDGGAGNGCSCDAISVPAVPVPTLQTCTAAVSQAISQAKTQQCVRENVGGNGGMFTSGACQQFEGQIAPGANAQTNALPQDCNSPAGGNGIGVIPQMTVGPRG